MLNENPTLTMIRTFVALGRAELPDRPSTPTGDPEAQRLLVRGMEAVGEDGTPVEVGGALLDLLGPRAPYFDQLVLDALARGVTQIASVGCGFDDRALRFRHPQVAYFDVDLEHVLYEKLRQIDRAGADRSGLTFAPADLRTDDIAEVLTRAGHDARKPSLFIAEHLFLFLEPHDVERLLVGLAQSAGPGTRLAVTAEVHPEGLHSDRVLKAADEIMFGGTSPLHTILPRQAWLEMFTTTGWRVEDPDVVTAVDHFAIPVDGENAQVQTQLMTASIA